MTNFEKIKQMSVEDMANTDMGGYFACPYDTPYVGCEMGKKFDDDVLPVQNIGLKARQKNEHLFELW